MHVNAEPKEKGLRSHLLTPHPTPIHAMQYYPMHKRTPRQISLPPGQLLPEGEQ
jgi:hypothetical protein